jgi:hypothetical protein
MAFRTKGSPPSTVVALAGLSLLAMAACGYRLGVGSCESDVVARHIAVPLFENASHEPRLENLLTEAFRDRIQALPCVSLCSRKQADALLKGKILSAESYTVAVDEEFFAMEYRLRVVVAVSLVRSEDGEVLWRDGGLQEEVSFYASSDALLFKDNREEALMDLAARISERAVDRLLLGF